MRDTSNAYRSTLSCLERIEIAIKVMISYLWIVEPFRAHVENFYAIVAKMSNDLRNNMEKPLNFRNYGILRALSLKNPVHLKVIRTQKLLRYCFT